MDIIKTIKEIFAPNDSNANQPKKKIKKPTVTPKKNNQPTLGHAPATHPITPEQLKDLVKAASDPAVQSLIQNELAPVFHPQANNPGQKRSGFSRKE